MSNQQGTLDIIASELVSLFQPLHLGFQKGNARILFAQLGYAVSDTQENGLVSALQSIALTVEELVGLGSEITDAVEQEDYGKLTQKVIEAGAKTKQLIESFPQIHTALTSQGVAGDIGQFSERLFGFLVSNYLYRKEGIGTALEFLGVIETTDFNITSEDPEHPPYTVFKLFLNRIFKWLSDPSQEFRDQFDWGTNGFDGTKLLPRLAKVIGSTGLPAAYLSYTTPPMLDMIFLEAYADTTIDPKGLFIGLASDLSLENLTISDDDWEAVFNFEFSLPQNAGLVIQPGGNISIIPPDASSISGEAGVKISIARTSNPSPFVIIGQSGGSRMEFLKAELELGTRLVWDGSAQKAAGEFRFAVGISEGKVVIDTTQGDGFIQNAMSGLSMEAGFSLRIGYSSETGFYFEGSSAFEIRLPVHISIGPVNFEGITIGFGIKPNELPISLGGDIRLTLGPLVAVVENMGLTARLTFPEGGGNLGPVNGSIRFKPPNGVGLSLDTGVVKGGGYLYFDFDKEEYAGVLELSIAGIVTVKAIGLITTKMPDGSKGFSLLLIITAEFGTGIQLGFGFTLIGVGGLLGLNRTMLLEPLAAGIRTGAINSIMFPPNPVENAPRIISDLRTYFPPYEGKFLIGPMVKIGWGTPTLVSLSFGLIIEIPGNIAIVGILSVNLPTVDAPIVAINVAFLGALEFDKKRIWFFASLFDSRILFLTLEGDMGLLMDYGDNPNFVLSVGGFHPLFNPPPLPFPNPRRIHIDVLSNPFQRISVETYFAVTSNTVQFGASAELYFGLSVVSIRGHFSFDALFQFSPFKFIIQMSFSVSLDVFGFGLFSIHLRLQLEGPTPWRAQGTGTLTIDLWLFEISISADFDVTWGDAENTTLPSVDVLKLLETEFNKIDNWRAKTPAGNNLLVSIRKLEGGADGLVLHPLGTLQISQRAVPLHVKVDKVGNRAAADAHNFSVSAATAGLSDSGQAPQEKFAIAQFQNLSNDEKLTRPAFQDFDGGIELSFAGRQLGATKAVRRVVRYETIIIDTNYKRFVRKWFSLIGTLFTHFLNGAAVTKSTLSHAQKKAAVPYGVDDRIKVAPPAYAVAGMADNKVLGGTALFTSEAQARDFMNVQLEANPNMAGEVHVIPAFEAVMN